MHQALRVIDVRELVAPVSGGRLADNLDRGTAPAGVGGMAGAACPRGLGAGETLRLYSPQHHAVSRFAQMQRRKSDNGCGPLSITMTIHPKQHECRSASKSTTAS